MENIKMEFVKGRKFPYQIGHYQFIKKSFAQWK
jgi:hypothetical protein